MKYEIVTDSSANLTDEMIDKYEIQIIPLLFRVGENEFYSYTKGEETNIKQFYEMMRNGETISTTSIDLEKCRTIFENVLEKGKDVLYIGFSSALSGSYNAGALIARELKEKYPKQKILAIDSLSASMGQGLLVYYAAEQRLSGKSIENVEKWLMDNRLNLCHWFTVDDLIYLKRGGRISTTTAMVGTVLGIKPIMHVDNQGRLVPVGKVRGRHKSLDALAKEMVTTCINPEEQVVFISHGDCIEDAEYLEKHIRNQLKIKDLVIHYVDPVIGAHSGPGTIALFFLGTKR